LATKDHFSSSWTSWVAGGKSHEFVVGLAGVGGRLGGVAYDGIFIDAGEARRLADAAAVVQVLEDGEGSVVGQAGAEQGGAGALGEAALAGATGEHAAAVLAIPKGNAEVVVVTQAVVRTVGILTAESSEVVHEQIPPNGIPGGQGLLGIVEIPRWYDNLKGTRPIIRGEQDLETESSHVDRIAGRPPLVR
jgi:hypothetical protein